MSCAHEPRPRARHSSISWSSLSRVYRSAGTGQALTLPAPSPGWFPMTPGTSPARRSESMAVSGSAEALPGGRLAGRRALVTGAASGIGLATARRLRSEGARVAGVDRHWPDELDEPEMHRLTADVTCAGQ